MRCGAWSDTLYRDDGTDIESVERLIIVDRPTETSSSEPQPLQHKLAAILYADVAGYSRLTGEDEAGTHRTLSTYLDAFTAAIQAHSGSVKHYAGDAILADFASVSQAINCAVEIQRELKARNEALPEAKRVQFRIGVNLGEVIVDRGEVYGNGVNVAARLETLAEPGGVCVSGMVVDAIGNTLPLGYEFLGEQMVKNIDKPVRAYRITLELSSKDLSPISGTSARKVNARPARWPIIGAAVVAMLLVFAASGWYLTRTDRGAAAHQTVTAVAGDQGLSVAVMPFENLSGDASQGFFADGVTDEILTTLSRFQDLRVAAKHNTFRYKGKGVDIKTVGEELRVRYVLSGSVRRSVDTVRVSAQFWCRRIRVRRSGQRPTSARSMRRTFSPFNSKSV